MRRLAIALLVVLAPSGCIFLTPPAGIRLGDHAGEFATVRPGEVGASQVTFRGFAAPDFLVQTPTYWTTVVPPKVTNGLLSAFVGVTVNLAELEGLTITELALKPGSDPIQAAIEIADTVKANLTQDPHLKSASVVSQTPDTLGRVPAVRLEVRTTDAAGNVTHDIAVSAIHDNKAFILVIGTPERRYETFQPIFDSVFHQFAFIPPVCPGASPDASARPCVPASATLVPGASPVPFAAGTPPV